VNDAVVKSSRSVSEFLVLDRRRSSSSGTRFSSVEYRYSTVFVHRVEFRVTRIFTRWYVMVSRWTVGGDYY